MSASKQVVQCPLCGTCEAEKQFSKKGRDFFRCPGCGIELQWPLPTSEELSAYYDESFASGMYKEFAAADEMKRMTARQRMKEIQRHVIIEGRWLDVGCANGVFVETAASHGVEAEGVELSAHAVEGGRSRGLKLHLGTVDNVPDAAAFDCVTAFDVLEHVLDPGAFLEGIRACLSDGGCAVLTVPNTGGIVRRLMGRRWYFYIPEEHLHYFNRRNLSALMQKHGFDVLDVGATYKPMTYDYSMTQFAEYNPLIYKVLKAVSFVVPSSLRARPIPLPIGELRIIARKQTSPAAEATSATGKAVIRSAETTSERT